MTAIAIIQPNDGDNPTISGRELHAKLEVETPYHKWFPRMCEYGFAENQDFFTEDKIVHNPQGGRPAGADGRKEKAWTGNKQRSA